MSTQRRCRNGHGFHPKYEPCPECGDCFKFNKHLHTANLNNHLYGAAERAEKQSKSEVAFVKQAKEEQRRVAGN